MLRPFLLMILTTAAKKLYNLFYQSYWVYIIPNLWGGWIDRQTHIHTHIADKSISKNQACTWFKNSNMLKRPKSIYNNKSIAIS